MDAIIEICEDQQELENNSKSVDEQTDDKDVDKEVSDEESDQLVNREKICVRKQLQILCDLYGLRQETYWDCYQPDQKDALKNKLSLIVSSEFVNERNLKQLVESLTKAIWRQAKYTDGVLYMSPIFVATVPYQSYRKLKRIRRPATDSLEYNLHPVFRVMKCIDPNTFCTNSCCMIFVDEHARVYQDWESYKRHNMLPSWIVIAPRRGVFTTTNGEVDLEIFSSPSSSWWSQIVRKTDKIINWLGFGSAIITILCLILLFIVPHLTFIGYIIAVAAVIGVISAIYAVVRSSAQIHDRSKHEKSLSLLNNEARSCWLGLAGGITGIVAGAASRGLTYLIANGKHVSNFVRVSVNAFNAACITVSGLGIVNGFAGIFVKWNEEKISTLELIQLSASLFLFTHSLYNFQTATTIIKDKQNMTINEFRDKLTKSQKKNFDKMAKQTIKFRGESGKSDIIRSLKAIPEKNTAFHGKIKADEIPFNSGEVSQFSRGQGIPPSEIESNLKQISLMLQMKQFVIVDPLDLRNIMVDSMENLSAEAFRAFVELCQIFVKQFGHNIEIMLNRIIAFEEFMSDIIKCIGTLGTLADMEISDFVLSINTIEQKQFLFENIKKYYYQFSTRKPNHKCKKCPGYFVNTNRSLFNRKIFRRSEESE